MTTHNITANTINTDADGVDMSASDVLFVAPGVLLAGLGDGSFAGASSSGGSITATIDGSVVGNEDGFFAAAGSDTILIGAAGSVTGVVGYGIIIGAGGNTITNNGEIAGAQDGIYIAGTSNSADNQIVNHGDIVGSLDAMYVQAGGNVVTNTGSLTGGTSALVLDDNGADGGNTVLNSGEMSASNTGIDVVGAAGFTDTIVNSGTIAGTVQKGIEEASSAAGSLNITNSGTVEGATAIAFRATSGDQLNNSGTIEGSVTGVREVAQGAMAISNNAGGTIAGAMYGIEFNVASAQIDVLQNNGTIRSNDGIAVLENGQGDLYMTNDAQGTIGGHACAILFDGSSDIDTLDNSGVVSIPYNGGAAVEEDGAASLLVTNSGTISATIGIDFLHSSTGANDTLDNSGTILGGVYEGGDTASLDITNSGHISGRIFFNGGTNIYDGTLGSVSGEIFSGSGQNNLTGGAGKETFDLTLGTNAVDAGGGNDVFYLGANLNSSQTIDGGTGNDVVQLIGDYSAGLTFTSTMMVDVETLRLVAGHSYNITMDDNTVAAGARLTVDASTLGSANGLTFNGSAETDGRYVIEGGAGNDTIVGGAGSDTISGGGGNNHITGGGGADRIAILSGEHDHLIYSDASDSTSTGHDIVTGFDFSLDKLDLDVTVTGVSAEVTSGRLNAGNIDANLTSAIGAGQLAAGHAVLFTPTTGGLAGHTFLIVDANGVAGYQAGQDYVFDLVSPANLSHLTTSTFI